MKKLIYIFMMLVAAAFAASCSGFNRDADLETPPVTQPKDSTINDPGWGKGVTKVFNVNSDMIATSSIGYHKNGVEDSVWMEPWELKIKVSDMTIYRDSYQPTMLTGRTLNTKRSTDPETKDIRGNLVTRHYDNQDFETNNFIHGLGGEWTSGRVFDSNGREASYLPYDGLYFSISNLIGAGDTTHFVRNDSIFALEKVEIEYTTELRVDPNSPITWRTWKRKATITVISFIGMVEHEEEIPTADFYISNLQWHATSGNRLFKKTGENNDGDIGNWEDGFLMSTDTHYIMLIVHYTVDAKDGKSDERYNGKEIIPIPKSEMVTPSPGREFNAVMYDYQRKKYIPCCLSKDYNFSYGSKYADGGEASFQPDINGSVMAGVKNFAKDKDASPSPWLETSCAETQYNGKNYYTITLKSSVHNSTTTVADSALKK